MNNADNTIIVEDLIEKKSKSKKLLFIGRKTTYLEAAKKLIEAYKLLKQEEDYKDFLLILWDVLLRILIRFQKELPAMDS